MLILLLLAVTISCVALFALRPWEEDPVQASIPGGGQSAGLPAETAPAASLSPQPSASEGSGAETVGEPVATAEIPAILVPYYNWLATLTDTQLQEVMDSWNKDFCEEEAPPLFNYENMIPDEYYAALELSSVGVRPSTGEEQTMEAKAAQAFKAMQKAAAEEGYTLNPYSGYRSHQRQTNNYNASIQRYLEQGHSQEEAVRRTQLYYAIPGTSEHEAGLAIDINGTEESFENTAEFVWLQENAASFGFVMRYPRDKYDLTKINYEPWHYRYVGVNHAYMMGATGYCLEEYVEMLAAAGEFAFVAKYESGQWMLVPE